MSGKDDSVFSASALSSTAAGKEIIKQRLLGGKGLKQFNHYKELSDREYPGFETRFVSSLQKLIESDLNPSKTMDDFAAEVGSKELVPTPENLQSARDRLSNRDLLQDRVKRILDSNFVKMTYPVFHALFDAAAKYYGTDISDSKRNAVIDGHIIAIDLSEPMDRIADRDEDLDYLEDYKLMNPYILQIARAKISEGGEDVLQAFEEGFKDARHGQYVDIQLKKEPKRITDEKMIVCYKKYRAVMGTAGANMALQQRPLSGIFHLGMAKAGECVGCGNEIEDSIKNGSVKIPSWPLYFYLYSEDIRSAFDLTMSRSKIYLDEGRLSLDMLPESFEVRPILEFLFLSVQHYNQHWFNVLHKQSPFDAFKKNLDVQLQ